MSTPRIWLATWISSFKLSAREKRQQITNYSRRCSRSRISKPLTTASRWCTRYQCSRIRILRFFQISKNMTFYVFWN